MGPKDRYFKPPYATLRRYEEGRFEITEEDFQIAFQVAEDILVWSLKEIQKVV